MVAEIWRFRELHYLSRTMNRRHSKKQGKITGNRKKSGQLYGQLGSLADWDLG